MYLAVDTETQGLSYHDQPFLVSEAWRNEGGELISNVFGVDDPDISFFPKRDELVFHNAKFDIQKLCMVGLLDREKLDPYKIHDTELLSHLLDENRPKRLKALAESLLGETTDEAKELAAVRRKLKVKKSDGYDAIPREILEPYARKDAEFTLRIFEHLSPYVFGDPDLFRLYQQEQELLFVLLDMEAAGMAVDVNYLETTAKELANEILESDLFIRDMVGEDFNPRSWQQIQAAFTERGIEVRKTDKATLAALDDELANAILKMRAAQKLHSTYIKPMLHEQREGIIHPNYRQWGTKGRRMSAGEAEDG